VDRPEWIAVNSASKDVYITLTNNSARGGSGQPPADTANPRNANVYGHVLRWREAGSDPRATSFSWNIFVLAGDPRQCDANKKGNIEGDTFGSPDGLSFDERGVLWIQTDVSTGSLYRTDYVNVGNNQMLAADTATGEIRRFLTGPRFCEVTGVDVTPDGRTMFVNIQHPGERPASDNNSPSNPGANSTWPDGPGRPRAATVVVTRQDGGIIGS
jgi:secreted PhoX family phosphatase